MAEANRKKREDEYRKGGVEFFKGVLLGHAQWAEAMGPGPTKKGPSWAQTDRRGSLAGDADERPSIMVRRYYQQLPPPSTRAQFIKMGWRQGKKLRSDAWKQPPMSWYRWQMLRRHLVSMSLVSYLVRRSDARKAERERQAMMLKAMEELAKEFAEEVADEHAKKIASECYAATIGKVKEKGPIVKSVPRKPPPQAHVPKVRLKLKAATPRVGAKPGSTSAPLSARTVERSRARSRCAAGP